MGKTKIVAFGDSVTTGTSAKLDVFHDCFQYETNTVNMVRESQTWCAILQRILSDWVEGGVQVVNAGTEGDTAQKGLARLERDVGSNSPDYVLVMFGAEEALAGVEAEVFRSNLEKIVTDTTKRNARPLLMTPPPFSERMTAHGRTLDEVRQLQKRLSHSAQIVRSLAEESALPLIDLHRCFLESRLAYDHLFEGWLPDGVAQTAMAPFVAGELLPVLGGKGFPTPILCDYRKAYSNAGDPDRKHNSGGKITFFDGRFYLGFGSQRTHMGPNGQGMVFTSLDGICWKQEAVLKLSPDVDANVGQPEWLEVEGRLFAYAATTFGLQGPPPWRNVTYGFERLGPGQWGEPFECGPGVFWHPRKWRDQCVVAVYAVPEEDAAVKLYSSRDGRNWTVGCTIFPHETGANETDLWVDGDALVAFARTGGGSRDELLVSAYFPDEDRWETVSTGRIIQAPFVFKAGENLMVSGRYCSQGDERFRALQRDWAKFNQQAAAGGPDPARMGDVFEADPDRVEEYHHGLRTGIFLMDDTRPRLVMEPLSAGDSSYTEVLRYGDEYLLADYSMHEYYRPIRKPGDWRTPCDIYVSRIRFGQPV